MGEQEPANPYEPYFGEAPLDRLTRDILEPHASKVLKLRNGKRDAVKLKVLGVHYASGAEEAYVDVEGHQTATVRADGSSLLGKRQFSWTKFKFKDCGETKSYFVGGVPGCSVALGTR
jgi:hypothetical protein